MDAAEHGVLEVIFLICISDTSEEIHLRLEGEQDEGAGPVAWDECRTQNIFWVPPETRWTHLNARAKLSKADQFVDDAMSGVERDNPALKGILPKDYARPFLDNNPTRSPHRFGQQHQVGR